jgi:D-glycero-D-manno-heptose 1,7-bisphosphate phosphatase
LEIGTPPSASRASARGLFLDRDGTLILDKHFLADPEGVELIPGVAAALRQAKTLGYQLFLFTNQSGIGRGLHTLEDVHRCNARMEALVGLPSPLFTDICIAPERPDEPSAYRKPSPRFILESIERHRLDPRACWMVGDREADVQAGLNAHIRAAAVCTGKYDLATWQKLVPAGVPVYADFPAFVASLAPAT